MTPLLKNDSGLILFSRSFLYFASTIAIIEVLFHYSFISVYNFAGKIKHYVLILMLKVAFKVKTKEKKFITQNKIQTYIFIYLLLYIYNYDVHIKERCVHLEYKDYNISCLV